MSGSPKKQQLLENVFVLTRGANRVPVISDRPQAILISDNRIEAIVESESELSSLRNRGIPRIDGSAKIAMPGLINSHCHTYATVLRGTENSQPLEVWALYTMAYGRKLNPSLIDAAVGLSAAEMIRGGVTSVIDHIPHVGLLNHTIAAHTKHGMRVGIAPFIQDIPDHEFLKFDLSADLPAELITHRPQPPKESRNFLNDFFAGFDDLPSRLTGMIGPNAPQRCSPDLWQVWRDMQEKHDALVHTHLLETEAQALRSHQIWEGGLVGEMARQNLLNEKVSVAHGIWLQDNERDLLAKHGVTVVHNPASNLMLGSGLMPFEAYRQLGLSIGIGSDSANTGGRHDIFEGIRLAATLPRLSEPNYEKWPAANEVMLSSIEAGAKALGLGQQLGQLAAGQLADLIMIDPKDSRLCGLSTNAETIAQHAGPGTVTDVMIDGEWVLRNRRLTSMDEAQLQAQFMDQRGPYLEDMSADLKQAHSAAPIFFKALSDFKSGSGT